MIIYVIRKLNTRVNTKARGHNFLEVINLKNFDAAKFLDDLHNVLWEDIRYERNIDDMWKLFWGVLDKHVPKKVKRLRKKANIPWVKLM